MSSMTFCTIHLLQYTLNRKTDENNKTISSNSAKIPIKYDMNTICVCIILL